MPNKVILIGAIRKGQKPVCGETMKNQLFLQRFNEVFDEVRIVDTYKWQQRPWCLFQIAFYLVFNHSFNIVISASYSSRYLIMILGYLQARKRTFFWVVGGSLPGDVKKGLYKNKYLNKLSYVLVQGKSMVEELRMAGVLNAYYVPNSKPIIPPPRVAEHKKKEPYRFVFLSRIHPDKGISDIFGAVEILCNQGLSKQFLVDFYGPLDDTYKGDFLALVSSKDNVNYCGYLDLTSPCGYSLLSSYDVMLFPTYLENEGFPGVILDAFMSGLPVIATEWNINKEFVKDGDSGFLVPVHDPDAIARTILRFLMEEVDLCHMKKFCIEYVQQFDFRKVLSVELFELLGLLEGR